MISLDVGKGEHHAVGLDPTGRRLHDKPLPNSEPKLSRPTVADWRIRVSAEGDQTIALAGSMIAA